MLKLNNLVCGYQNKALLEKINLNLSSPQILFLIGPNGAGKSTLLKTIFGLIKPLAGHVESEKLSMLESDPQAVFSITPRELFQISDQSKHFEKELIHLFELENLFDKDMVTLSAGQAQLVWIAHILSLGAKVVLLDEPFTHLDWAHQKKVAQIIAHFKNKYSTTFVIASHDLSLTVELADSVAVLGKHTLLSVDAPEKIFSSNIIRELFDFDCFIDENPIDGSRRLTIGKKHDRT